MPQPPGRRYPGLGHVQWFHAAEDSMLLPAVAKVYRCKRFPASRTPERLEEGTQAVQRVLQVSLWP